MVEVRGRRVVITPPAGAVAFVADVTDWTHDPWPLRGPVELELPRGAILEYAFLDAAGAPLADPDNPASAQNPWRPYARVVRLRGAPSPPSYPKALLGRVHPLRTGGRRIVVYEPPAGPAASLLVFDGVAYHRIGRLAHAAEALWRDGAIVPLRLVFSEPEDREREYRFDPALERHLLDDVLPAVEAAFGPGGPWGAWGASLGGLAALWLGLEHPDVFARVGAQSPALLAAPGGRDARRDPEWLAERYRRAERGPARVALQVGRLEWLLAPARRFAAVLAERGTAHEYREYPSGHNWTTWRIGAAEGLVDLFGADLDVR
ncbi:esterase [Oceanithermus profundus DSM 14977]|uniref:Esterase n=1 Tax=Oceanithermus profundus (strain DSM 14977 / NBRC 100410 / VKM B-2274 / 506) TaxID=670487 RepID=E4U9F0_OCEP5|nr:alpha/beta hydrolase-fold protein [Oceanithermus profundus]ADR37046.1 esterase [Oceanithermus profundus DSM 14977]